MAKRITYRQLAEQLRELGYTDTRTKVQGKGLWLFEHPGNEKATIFLPIMPLNRPVETMHLTAVRLTLKVHGILKPGPELAFFQPTGDVVMKKKSAAEREGRLSRRARNANEQRFRDALSHIPDVEPEEQDRL